MLGLAPADRVIVCNGYKDREYIRLALIGQTLGHRVFIVVEKKSELPLILEEAKSLGVSPLIGVRARLATIGKGNWQNTGGEKSKFGLNASQILQMIELLTFAVVVVSVASAGDADAATGSDSTGTEAPAPARASDSAFWMGPDQWMVEAPLATHEDLSRQIAAQANGAASVTEQTDAWCRFDLKGERLADVFERLCAADLRRFTGGEAVRTTIEHLGCFLICRSHGLVSVIGPRSSAESLHHALLTALKVVTSDASKIFCGRLSTRLRSSNAPSGAS